MLQGVLGVCNPWATMATMYRALLLINFRKKNRKSAPQSSGQPCLRRIAYGAFPDEKRRGRRVQRHSHSLMTATSAGILAERQEASQSSSGLSGESWGMEIASCWWFRSLWLFFMRDWPFFLAEGIFLEMQKLLGMKCSKFALGMSPVKKTVHIVALYLRPGKRTTAVSTRKILDLNLQLPGAVSLVGDLNFVILCGLETRLFNKITHWVSRCCYCRNSSPFKQSVFSADRRRWATVEPSPSTISNLAFWNKNPGVSDPPTLIRHSPQLQ